MITLPSDFETMDGLFQFDDLDQWSLFTRTIDNDNMGNENLNCSGDMMQENIEMEFDKFLLGENLSYEPSSSFSSKETLSMDSADQSTNQILRTDSISSNLKIPLLEPYNPTLISKLSNLESEDDVIITRAMVSIIASISSNSSSSSPPPNRPQNENQEHKKSQYGAFMPFKSLIAPEYEMNFENNGQKMIKKSLSMLRSIGLSRARESKPTNLHHMISERRRREKLNESFETLRMLLPRASKKDKTSVLINTTNYLKTLEAQITDLNQKNRKLEAYVPNLEGINDPIIGSNKRAQVKISKTSSPKSDVLQINLKVTAMTECDIVELVLSILESLKLMKAVSLVSVDAYTFSPQMNLHASASLKLRIKESDWNEAFFHEAMRKAVDDVTSDTMPLFSKLGYLF